MDARPELLFPEPPLSDGEVMLRESRAADVDAILALRFDPDILRYTDISPDATAADIRAWHSFTEQERREGRGLYFAIASVATGELLGACDLRIPGEDVGIGELGYLLAPARAGGALPRARSSSSSRGASRA